MAQEKQNHIALYPLKDRESKQIDELLETAVSSAFLLAENDKYRALFEATPVSLWEEDFSEIKKFIDQLREDGVTDFRAHFDRHPEDVFHYIEHINVIDVNQTTLHMYRAKSKAHLLDNLEAIFGPDAFNVFKEELIVIGNGGTLFEHEGTNYTLDGDKLNVFVRWSVPPGFEESLSQVIVSIMDVTSQKRAAAQLRLQAKALESAANAIVISDNKGDILWVNPAFTTLTGYAYNEVLGLNSRTLLLGEDSEAMYQALWQTIRAGDVWHSEELVNHRKDGSVYYEQITVAPVKGEDGLVAQFIAIKEDISRHKEAEHELRLAKEYAEQLFRVVPSAIITVDLHGHITSWNPKATELFGYSEEEIIGQSCETFMMPPCTEKCGLYAKEAAKPVNGFECNVRTKDGRILTVTKNVDLLRDGTGQIIGGIESIEDITERKQLETKLRRQLQEEELLQQVLALTTSNNEFVEILTHICEKLSRFYELPKSAFALLNPEQTQAEVITEYCAPGYPSSIGAIIPVENNASMSYLLDQRAPLAINDAQSDPILAPVQELMRELGVASILLVPILIGDEIVGTMGFDAFELKTFTAEDIQLGQRVAMHVGQALLRNQAKLELQAQRDFAQQIMDNMGQGLLVVDVEWSIEYVNAAFAGLLGHQPEHLIGNSALNLVYKLDPNIVAKVREEWDKGATQSFELPLQHIDGSPVHVLMTGVPQFQNGVLVGATAVMTDLTARKQTEAALATARDQAIEASRLKSEFLANMSHEIRTPLNAVIGMTGLMLDTQLSTDQRDYAETIRSSGDVLLSLINDILDFSKIEAGKLEMETQPFDLRDCVEEALDVVVTKAVEKSLEVAYVIDDGVPHAIVGDVTRLRQILVNLLNNAIKFTESGEIVLSVSRLALAVPGLNLQDSDYSMLQFSVKDTGIGIPAERVDRLFKSFSQVDASTTRKYGGTGLGLAISKRLVEMMGGRIWVESEEGIGSTFHFTIETTAVRTRRRVYLHSNQPQLAGKQLLIVDDNETNRHILKKQAELWGMKPQISASGAEALDRLRKGELFDLAILDMHMPEMDGLTLAAAVRKIYDEKMLPLVMLSSIGDHDNLRTSSYFAAYLTKPVKRQQLFNTLNNLFNGAAVSLRQEPQKLLIDPQMGKKHPLRILLAEDNLVNQKVALRILERMGYRADVVADGLEVLESLQRQFYDVVLMDVQMPHMDGVVATQQIREIWPPDKQPQIVAMTANALTGDKEKYLNAGMDAYISKPVRIQELVRVLTDCCSAKY
ncbi:MAG: PAS domain S-box protein [Anaerolineales bacterium]|nr:PAS domain S-box protein [Anaerolineales bacterium]